MNTLKFELPNPSNDEAQFILFKELLNGNHDARNKLIVQNIRLALSIANKYKTDTKYPDIYNCCLIALIKAVDKFDVNHGVTFKYYARKYIEGFINNIKLNHISYYKKELLLFNDVILNQNNDKITLTNFVFIEKAKQLIRST
jgi:DNA-directed RNA polymerase specialized sigma subunit